MDAVLGRGGFGIVYQATSISDGRQLALKTWAPKMADIRSIRRFQQEAEVWIALGAHPHIVQAYRVDVLEGQLFIAMELVAADGAQPNSLDGWIEQGTVDEREVAEWGIQVCHAMEYAAQRGIRSHRDLKPANIMLNATGAVKVTDFGLATHPFLVDGMPELPEAGSMAHLFRGQTVRGIGFGTPAYMPPEQFVDAAASDGRTDIYALGIILYELLTGNRPVNVPLPPDQTMKNRLRWWLAMEKAHRSLILPDLPFRMGPILTSCIAKRPTDRYRDFSVLRAELEALSRTEWGRTPSRPVIPIESVDVLVERANSLRRLERWNGAASIYREVVQMDPSRTTAWSHLGTCFAQLENHQGAEMAHLKAAASAPDSADVLARWGHARFLAGRMEQASDLFRQALALSPNSAQAHFGQALAHERERDVPKAMDSARLATQHDASLLPAWLLLGRLAARMGSWTLALESTDEVLSRIPQHRQAVADRACWLVCTGAFDKAEYEFLALRRHGPLKPLERVFRAVLRAQTQRIHLAIRDLAMAQGAVPSSAHAIRATAWARLGRWSLVEAELDRMDEPMEHPVPATQRALLHQLEGRHSVAAARASHILVQHPEQVAAALLLAAARLHLGHFDECLEVLRRVEPEEAWRDVLDFNQGVALLAAGHPEEALAVYTDLSERGSWPDAYHNAGIAALLSGETRVARDWLLKAHVHRRRPLPAPSPWSVVFRDLVWPLQPEQLAHVLSNGFEPRFRIPLVRPMLLLWPAWIPPSMLEAHD